MTNLTLFAPVIPLLLLLSLSCQPTGSSSSNTTLKAPSNSGASSIHDSGRLTAAASVVRFTDADFTRHVNQLNARIKQKLAARRSHGFSIVIQKPFVVIGDEP